MNKIILVLLSLLVLSCNLSKNDEEKVTPGYVGTWLLTQGIKTTITETDFTMEFEDSGYKGSVEKADESNLIFTIDFIKKDNVYVEATDELLQTSIFPKVVRYKWHTQDNFLFLSPEGVTTSHSYQKYDPANTPVLTDIDGHWQTVRNYFQQENMRMFIIYDLTFNNGNYEKVSNYHTYIEGEVPPEAAALGYISGYTKMLQFKEKGTYAVSDNIIEFKSTHSAGDNGITEYQPDVKTYSENFELLSNGYEYAYFDNLNRLHLLRK